jgi:hypothetical protein
MMPIVIALACFIGMFLALAVMVACIESMEQEKEAD